ncbi:hypothetical protein [Bradyrhizobium yuanmingense]
MIVETVSRAVSQLHSDGVLAFVGNGQRESSRPAAAR